MPCMDEAKKRMGGLLCKVRGKRTRHEMACLCGLHATQWSQYEDSRRLPSLLVFGSICSSLKLDANKILKALTKGG